MFDIFKYLPKIIRSSAYTIIFKMSENFRISDNISDFDEKICQNIKPENKNFLFVEITLTTLEHRQRCKHFLTRAPNIVICNKQHETKMTLWLMDVEVQVSVTNIMFNRSHSSIFASLVHKFMI